jgi:hypothetical protein
VKLVKPHLVDPEVSELPDQGMLSYSLLGIGYQLKKVYKPLLARGALNKKKFCRRTFDPAACCYLSMVEFAIEL